MNLDELLNQPDSAQLAHAAEFSEELITTLAAMANGTGGVIVIGSLAEESASPQLNESVLKEWIRQISQATQPPVIPESEIHEIDGKRVAVLRTLEAPIKPVMAHGRGWRRVGAMNYALSAAEIAQLHLQSLGRSWDALTVDDAGLEDIDADRVGRFIRLTNEKRRRNVDSHLPLGDLLERMALLNKGKITAAGLLLFGKAPQRHFPHARIKAGRFKTDTVILDDHEITGTLFEQIDAAFDFVRKHLTVRLVITGQPQRDEVWDYPLEAIREGLINAICHRDYSIPAETQIRIYDDQLIIWNPGNLPADLRLDDLRRKHQSILRNKLIGSAFYDAGLVEKWGSGTNRIVEECKRIGLPEPEWREHQGLMLALRKDLFTEDFLLDQGLNERQLKAVAFVKKRRRITNQDYQQLTGVSKRTASEDLRALEEKKIVERVGSTGKGTYYKLRGK